MTNTVTEEQIANLRNHAAFVAKLPDIQMYAYAWEGPVPHECGAPICAIGHAVNNPDLPKPHKEDLWRDYSSRIFGVHDSCKLGRCCFGPTLPNDPAIISNLMLKVADELESTQ